MPIGLRGRILSIVFLFGFAFPQILVGNEAIRFSNLGTQQGLPYGGVLSLAEDELGYMWLGTKAGLRRFDGYELKTVGIDRDPLDRQPTVHSLLHAGKARFVLGTSEGPRKFNHLQEARGYQSPVGDVTKVNALVKVPETETVYLGTRTGLMRWASPLEQPELVHEHDDVTALAIDSIGSVLWLGNASGEVKRWDIGNRTPPQTVWSCPVGIQTLLAGRQGELWIGTSGLGLFKIDEFGKMRQFTDKLTASPRLPSNVVTSLLEDSRQRLWVGSARGLCR